MTFLTLILKNLWRNKTRTLLTTLGISIGIATIVVFGLITSGLKESLSEVIKPGGADFTVTQAGAADFIVSLIDVEKVDVVKSVAGVEKVTPYLMAMMPIDNNPFFIVGGIEPEKLDGLGFTLTSGRAYQNGDELMVGKIAAKNKNVSVGSTMTIKDKKYTVVGTYESGVTMQDSGVLTTLSEVQRIQGTSDKITLIMVNVAKGFDVKKVAQAVEDKDKELLSLVELEDFNAIDQGPKFMDALSWIISLLAVVVGGIGVMNTIIMSVFERTREIGVLRALGWKKKRIVAMILGESLVIGVLATVIGIVVGLGLVWLLMQAEMAKSFINIQYQPMIFVRAFGVSMLVMILGAIYPALRASKLQPTEALRYE